MPARATQYELIVKALREDPKARGSLLAQPIDATRRAQKIYGLAYHRWTGRMGPHASRILRIRDRLAIGLGEESVLETGLTIHHIYRVPMIRGSALKGLAAHFCHEVWGSQESRFKESGEDYCLLFGKTTDCGFLTFHDAWILPEDLTNQGIVRDVMTPHHGSYYMSSGRMAPTDFDDPNPITFLTVTGRFHFVVECQDSTEEGTRCARLGLDLLQEALQHWGAGAKTNAGYGRFTKP